MQDYFIVPIKKIKEIGIDGLNSKVYLANDIILDRKIVVKDIEIRNAIDYENFKNEVRISNKTKHPNISEVIIAGEKYLNNIIVTTSVAMPFYKNGNLKNYMKNNKLTEKENVNFILGLVHAVIALHLKSLMHLDIKPDNILVSDRKEAILSDFGISKFLKKNEDYIEWDTLKEEDKKFHPFLKPPELLIENGANISLKTDIFLIGVTMYLILNNKTLEDLTGFCLLDKNISRKNKIKMLENYQNLIMEEKIFVDYSSVSEKFERIIKKCISIDPMDRYESVMDIQNDICT